jgi:hypothetical protein
MARRRFLLTSVPDPLLPSAAERIVRIRVQIVVAMLIAASGPWPVSDDYGKEAGAP